MEYKCQKKQAGAHLIIESDSQEVVDLINDKAGSRSEIFWVIAEVHARKHDFQDFKVQHVNRFCNALSHSLAKMALEKNDEVWLDHFPPEILYLVNFLSMKNYNLLPKKKKKIYQGLSK